MTEYEYEGKLLGHALKPMEIAEVAYKAGFRELDLIKAVACALAESDGYLKAQNTKTIAGSGDLVSRDVGLWQISIPAHEVGTSKEEALWDSKENARRAYLLWTARGWQPWVAMGQLKEGGGIALDVEAKGKYLKRALWGVGNFYRKQMGVPIVPSPYVKNGKPRLARWAMKA